MTAATQNFHVPLSETLYGQLRDAAKRAGRPATELAREFLRVGLERLQQERIDQEIRAYAVEMAGTSDDLDEELEEASLEVLRSTD